MAAPARCLESQRIAETVPVVNGLNDYLSINFFLLRKGTYWIIKDICVSVYHQIITSQVCHVHGTMFDSKSLGTHFHFETTSRVKRWESRGNLESFQSSRQSVQLALPRWNFCVIDFTPMDYVCIYKSSTNYQGRSLSWLPVRYIRTCLDVFFSSAYS